MATDGDPGAPSITLPLPLESSMSWLHVRAAPLFAVRDGENKDPPPRRTQEDTAHRPGRNTALQWLHRSVGCCRFLAGLLKDSGQ